MQGPLRGGHARVRRRRSLPGLRFFRRPDRAEGREQQQVVDDLRAPPAITSGQPKLETPSRYPASSGLTADARLRGTDVMLAAAARSPGATTAIT